MGNSFVLKLKKRRTSHLGVLVLAVLLAILSCLGSQIVPVYLAQRAFYGDLVDLAGRSALGQQDNLTITRQVVQLAQSRNFTVQEHNVLISRVPERPELAILVDYTTTAEFPGGYIYVFYFHSVAEGLL